MSRIETSSEHEKNDDSINPRPFIIPLFLPHMGCPHQCVFCNQKTITGKDAAFDSPKELKSWIDTFLTYKTDQRENVQIAFFGGNFLGLEQNKVISLLDLAEKYVRHNKVNSIRFSTRPDTICEKNMDLISAYSISAVELGAQSMDDRVLRISGRGHTARNTERAVHILKKEKYQIGIQMMVGLPGDSDEKSLETARKIVKLKPDFVRIYPTLVFKHSPLAEWYRKGLYQPMPLNESIHLVKRLYLIFLENRIQVIRMGLQWTDGFDDQNIILAGPYHPAFGHLVHSGIFLDKAVKIMESERTDFQKIQIRVHPRSIPKMRGDKNENILALKKKFHMDEILVVPDRELNEDDLKISGV